MLYLVLALVVLQRLGELVYAERNTQRLRARGAIEIAAWQHPLFVILHTAWLAALALAVSKNTVPSWPLLALFFILQAARVWVLATLGPFWTTRVMTLPGAPLVRTGPYRFLRHPNYAIVALEIAVLPLAFHAPAIAAIFTLLNAALLALRISAENAALAPRATLPR